MHLYEGLLNVSLITLYAPGLHLQCACAPLAIFGVLRTPLQTQQGPTATYHTMLQLI
jgi:hypothetical protein